MLHALRPTPFFPIFVQMSKNSLFLLLLLLPAVLSSCKMQDDDSHIQPFEQEPGPAEYAYLALGDSYTIGESVAENKRFPVQLADSLAEKGIHLKPVDIVARTGWTTDELMAGIEDAPLEASYDLVTLLIGVNNQYRGRDTAEYRVEFTRLLDRAIHFAANDKGRVIVISIPDYGVTPFAAQLDQEKIAREIDAFNRINQEITEARTIRYVGVTDISRLVKEDLTLIANDGLHPSGKMYALWISRLIPGAEEILKE